ncbi:hypothetical protein SAMN05216226_104124 [Halovenus aranensis]|uniref:Uncharacterized protein n=1 Tax=Halovenus aranensis TaxID=890420 RepID=A0A1G8U9E2_9EURY|nr:hypothetical protein [Halovenus aranensis]SDJ50392.1 hypothetical protein SAMN05216226_104124 [Halovenus aranensis]
MDDPLTKRRRLIQTAGAGGAALLAGCSGILDSQDGSDSEDGTDGDDGSDGDSGIESGDGDTREVGMVAEPDQQALSALQQELQSGNLTQQEAVQQQQEIIAKSIEDLKTVLSAETSIEVTEELPQLGALRVDGDPYELVDAMTADRVSALVPAGSLDVQQPTG